MGMPSPESEEETLKGPHGEAIVRPPDKRGVGKKVPRGSEQYHGFWRVVYYPAASERSAAGVSAPEVLRAKDEEDAAELARRAVEEGFEAVKDARYGVGRY